MKISFYQVVERYSTDAANHNKLKAAQEFQSLMIRYIVPCWGGNKPKGARATAKEINQSLDFLKTIPSTRIEELESTAYKAWEEEGLSKERIRKFRYNLNQFLEFAQKGKYYQVSTSRSIPPYIPIHASPGEARADWHGCRAEHGKTKKPPYALGAKCFKDDYFNRKLKTDLEDYEKYRASFTRPKTVKEEMVKIKQMLGWIHRFYGISLKNLRLFSLIQYSQLTTSLSECGGDWQKFLLRKLELKEFAKEDAQKNMTMINAYMDFLDNHTPFSKITYLDVLLSIARFTYRQEIGSDDFPEDKDIPIIRNISKLKLELRKQAAQQEPPVPHEAKSVPWEVALKVLEKLRLLYEQKYTFDRHTQKLTTNKRTIYALATDLQNFLSVAITMARPPLRSSNYCDLEMGRSLLYGLYDNGRFIPRDELSDPSLGKWYIYIIESKSKIKKEYLGEILNLEFPDGKTLYGYINEWLNWGRESHGKVKHNFFFRGCANLQPIDYNEWRNRFVYAFNRHANVPVTPHELRKMYVTFMKRKQANEAILDGAAIAQQHTRRTQSLHYDKLSYWEKMLPALEFHRIQMQEIMDNF